MSDAAAAGNGDAGQAQDASQGQGPDLAAFQQQLGDLTSGQEELRQLLQSAPWSQEDAQQLEQQEPGLDLSFLEQYADPAAEPQSLADQLQPAIQQLVDRQTQQAIEPLQKQMQEARVEREAQNLVDEFPDLATPEVAQHVVQTARELAQQLGQPELANEPKFWRMAYMMGKAAESANQEGRDAPNAAHLEGGGGATPSGSQVNLGDLIVSGGSDGSQRLPGLFR
jgi:hypothetical protein